MFDELLNEAPSQIDDLGDQIRIKHLYMERKMIPLNIYMDQADDQQLKNIVQEYGQAIKQLAAANIFPGDMLFKNFGVTRHSRVIFYDYDEINYMTAMNFRRIPEALSPEQELASEPWYSVAENDVFPEELALFLCYDPQIRDYFTRCHCELFTVSYWQALQQRIRDGYIEDVFAYPLERRFCQQFTD